VQPVLPVGCVRNFRAPQDDWHPDCFAQWSCNHAECKEFAQLGKEVMQEKNRFVKIEIMCGDAMCGSCEFADNNLQICTIFFESIKIGRTQRCIDGEIKSRSYLDVEDKQEETL
jgi:hypothetical protein